MSINVSQSQDDVLFCPQSKDIQLTVLEEKRNQNIFAFKKLKSGNFDLFLLKKLLKSINQLAK